MIFNNINFFLLLKNVFKKIIVKFLFVGILNTCFGYGVYACLVYINMPYLIALFVANLLGIIFNYFSFGRMVFKKKGERGVFEKFISAYALVYVFNAYILFMLTEYKYLSVYLAQGICLLPSVAINWLLMNYWVYRND